MASPSSVSILAFQVGFGDCFLVRFHYPGDERRHVLVDFGSFPKASWLAGGGMKRLAEEIQRQCGGKLDAVVATHRHADHINGFTLDGDDPPGAVIAACKPDVVVQPWTEDPAARTNARKPTASFVDAVAEQDEGRRKRALARGCAFVDSLDDWQKLAPAIQEEARRFRGVGADELADELSFYGENGLSNLSAVKNLQAMGEAGSSRYVYHGADSGLGKVLPGVRITVLGPPTLEQSDEIKKYAARSKEEYWLKLTRTALRGRDAERPLFARPDAISHEMAPAYARWLISRLRALRGRQLLDLVRSLDDVLNNTSVVLLFEVGGLKLLFPGDAQLENWAYALRQDGASELLGDVDFYKVGHHGSLNATPKTMVWENFKKRGEGLTTVVSTLAGVHGGKHGKPTEVPREPLVAALRAQSKFTTTEDLDQRPDVFAEISLAV